jgi:hypothetical protein
MVFNANCDNRNRPMATPADKLRQIKDIDVTLDETYPRDARGYTRPNLRIRAVPNSAGEMRISVEIAPLWGQQGRYIDLLPHEARQIADALNTIAVAIEIIAREDNGTENETAS